MALARLNSDGIYRRLESCASADSLGEFAPLCSALLEVMSTSPSSAPRISEGSLKFLKGSMYSPAITATVVHLLGAVLMRYHSTTSAAVLASLPTILAVLRHHIRDPTVCHIVLMLLGASAAGGTPGQARAQELLASSGALPLIAEAAELHASCSNPDVSSKAFIAAANVGFRQPAVKATLVSLGFVRIAVRTLLERGHEWSLLGEASLLVGNLLGLPGQRAAVLRNGIVPKLLSVLPAALQSKDPELTPQVWGQFAHPVAALLRQLFEGEGHERVELEAEEPAVVAVLQSLAAALARRPRDDERSGPVVSQLMGCVLCLCERGDLAELRKHGAIALLEEAAARFPELRGPAEIVCADLRALSR